MRIPIMRALAAGALLAAAAGLAPAQDLATFEKKVTVKLLDNGLRLIVCERPEAPVFSFFTHVDVGGDREVPGITGLAHMFEHMAFKGTDKIGTKDYGAEKAALEKVEAAYAAYDVARREPVSRDDKKVAELEKTWKDAIAEADKHVVANEFGEIVDREGGVGLNAFTSSDETGYFFSFPANRLELWAYLESERLLKPVMREFYKERDVVYEERRMRTDSNPIGRMVEQMLSAAFTAHTYGQPVVGWASDLQTFSATDAQAFHEKYARTGQPGRRRRGRRESRRGGAHRREVLRPPPETLQARAGADAGAAAERGTHGAPPRNSPAFLRRGVQEARGNASRRCHLRRYQ